MLYRACVQRYMYKRNTVYSIPCQQCLPKKYGGPDYCHNKKEMQWTLKLVTKETEKEDFKIFKEEQWNCFLLSWNGTGYRCLENTNYCRWKAYWKRLIILIEGIEIIIKKLSQAERAHLQLVYEIDPICDTFIKSIKTWLPRGLKLLLGFKEKWSTAEKWNVGSV